MNNIKDITVSIAECATVGNVMAKFGSESGSSKYYYGGVNFYKIKPKVEFLGVNYEKAKKCDCVSEEVVKDMAKGITKMLNTRFGISTTGYAEPYVNEDIIVPVPFIYTCIYDSVDDTYDVEKIINCYNLERVDFQKYVANFIHGKFKKYVDM